MTCSATAPDSCAPQSDLYASNMSARLAVAFASLCLAGGFACAALVVGLAPAPRGASGDVISAEPASPPSPRAGLRRPLEPLEAPLPSLPSPTSTPLSRAVVVRPTRPIDVADPWTNQPQPETDEQALHLLHRRIVSRAPRPIDVADPWQSRPIDVSDPWGPASPSPSTPAGDISL